MLAVSVVHAAAAAGVLALVTGVGGVWIGVRWQEGVHARAEVDALNATIDEAARNVHNLNKLMREDADKRSKLAASIATQKETVIRETLQPVYTTCVITPDSLRNLNEQISTINAAIAGTATLPAGGATSRLNNGRVAASFPAASSPVR